MFWSVTLSLLEGLREVVKAKEPHNAPKHSSKYTLTHRSEHEKTKIKRGEMQTVAR